MTNLERRYRALLKVLPGWYREDREEEMVGLFLVERTDELDLEHSWPGWGETGAMLALAIRTRFAASGAPERAVRLGEVARWLAVLGLLLGLKNVVHVIYSEIVVRASGEVVAPQWNAVLANFSPVVVIALLLRGHRTWAKVVAGAAFVPWLVNAVTDVGPAGALSVLWQLPVLVAFVALCLGFHREAPTPRVGPMLWWCGGAVLVGAAELLAWQVYPVVLPVVLLAVRVLAYVRGEVALGRALSLLALWLLPDVVVTYLRLPPELRGYVLVAAALVGVSAAAPVRRASVLRSRLP
ncbi:hypothetical protein SK803_09825 [Lentzea sp. BCCO 10_0856]|uniref:Uncharacterized protein n=1 Tax=Lentzea miocenica TaxID=3095431 RepID=A0ABU4SX89_9PSEU|nr:hypothetical protein [Lentzea sp. BCCO 10_0856]MDX8030510.1 hypothetical protein [Lentzea sp. BCCO 10_0856]